MLKLMWKNAAINFRQWHKNSRVYLTFILAFMLCVMLSGKAISFANSYGTSMQVFEAFVWVFGDASSVMMSSLLLIFLFSDIPFVYQTTPYCITRINRRIWVGGQVLYLLAAAVIYSAFLLVSTCILCSPVSFVGNKWSDTSAMLGYSGIGAQIALPASVKTMEMSTPYACALHIFILVTLYIVFIGTSMLFWGLGKKKLLGVFSVFAINLYGLLLNPQIFIDAMHLSRTAAYKANVLTGWLSPLNHATYYMHNFGYDYLPTLYMSDLVFLILIALNIWGISRRIRKFEFSFIQVEE